MRHSGGKDASGCAWGSAAAARLLAIDILFVIRPPISNNNKREPSGSTSCLRSLWAMAFDEAISAMGERALTCVVSFTRATCGQREALLTCSDYQRTQNSRSTNFLALLIEDNSRDFALTPLYRAAFKRSEAAVLKRSLAARGVRRTQFSKSTQRWADKTYKSTSVGLVRAHLGQSGFFSRLSAIDAAGSLFHPILRPSLFDGLPLHVRWAISTAALKRNHMVDDVAGAWPAGQVRSWARLRSEAS